MLAVAVHVDATCVATIVDLLTHSVCVLLDLSPIEQIAVSYQTLEILQEHGIAANDIQKLNAAGFYTIESVRIHYWYRRHVDSTH